MHSYFRPLILRFMLTLMVLALLLHMSFTTPSNIVVQRDAYSPVSFVSGHGMSSLDSLSIEVTGVLPFSLSVDFLTGTLHASIIHYYPVLRVFHAYLPNDLFSSYRELLHLKMGAPPTRVKLHSLSHVLPSGITENQGMNVTALWDLNLTGDGIIVGIVDSGVNFTGMLAGKEYMSKSFDPDNPNDSHDYFGHGTKVASLIVGQDTSPLSSSNYGMAPNAKIVNSKLSVTSDGYLVGDIFAAMDWVASIPEVDVINLSFGASEFGEEDLFEQAANNMVANGKIVVVSAGNEASYYPDFPYLIGSPGTSPGVITVAALTSSGDHVAYYSSRGPTGYFEPKPDIATYGSTPYGQGTSFAAPRVTGIIALLLEDIKNNGWTITAGGMKALLIESATDLGDDPYAQGAGRINAGKAYAYLHRDATTQPYAFTVTPKALPYSYYHEIPPDTVFNQRIYVSHTSSSPQLSFEYTGNLFGHVKTTLVHSIKGTFTYELRIDSYGLPVGTLLNGSLLVHDGLNTRELTITTRVVSGFQHRLLMDEIHTIWDDYGYDRIDGLATKEFIRMLLAKGIWVDEIRNGSLTPELLSNYDLLWIPDPMDVLYDDEKSQIPTLNFTNEELNAIKSFYEEGGKVMLDFTGRLGPYGTDVSKLNDFFVFFGISAYESPLLSTQANQHLGTILNTTELYQKVSVYTAGGSHFTSYNTQTIPLAVDSNSPTIVTQFNENQGQLIISSNTYFRDNTGMNGQRITGESDRKLAENLVQMLLTPHTSLINHYEFLADKVISFSVSNIQDVQTNGIILQNTPHNITIQLLSDFDTSITFIGENQTYYRYDFPVTSDSGISITTPKWVSNQGIYLRFQFNYDSTSLLPRDSLVLKVNGNYFPAFRYTIDSDTNLITVLIPESAFSPSLINNQSTISIQLHNEAGYIAQATLTYINEQPITTQPSSSTIQSGFLSLPSLSMISLLFIFVILHKKQKVFVS